MTKPRYPRRTPQSWRHRGVNRLANLALARQLEEDVAPANRTRWRAYRSVLEAAGIDPETLEADGHPYNAATLRRRWVEPHAAGWDHAAGEVPGFPPLAQAQWKPVYALKIALRRLFGLTHRLTGIDRRGCRYAVDQFVLEGRREQLEKREGNLRAEER